MASKPLLKSMFTKKHGCKQSPIMVPTSTAALRSLMEKGPPLVNLASYTCSSRDLLKSYWP